MSASHPEVLHENIDQSIFERARQAADELVAAEQQLIEAASRLVSADREAVSILDTFSDEYRNADVAEDFDLLGPSLRKLLEVFNESISPDESVAEVAKQGTQGI